jgi:hypothetical protein
MFRKILLCSCMVVALFVFTACSGGGGSSEPSVDQYPTLFVGAWRMVTSNGADCLGCVTIIANADGTGSVTDNIGAYLGSPGQLTGRWSISGNLLTTRAEDGSNESTIPIKFTTNDRIEAGVNVYERM